MAFENLEHLRPEFSFLNGPFAVTPRTEGLCTSHEQPPSTTLDTLYRLSLARHSPTP